MKSTFAKFCEMARVQNRLPLQAGIGTAQDLTQAKKAFDQFLAGRQPNANQIEFIDLIANHLTVEGAMPEIPNSAAYSFEHLPHDLLAKALVGNSSGAIDWATGGGGPRVNCYFDPRRYRSADPPACVIAGGS